MALVRKAIELGCLSRTVLRTDGEPQEYRGRGLPGPGLRLYPTPKVLVAVESGIRPKDGDAAIIFSTPGPVEYARGSILQTSNKGLGEWGDPLVDTEVVSAGSDRSAQHSHALNIRGERYRLREKRHAGLFSSHHLLGAAAGNGKDNHPD